MKIELDLSYPGKFQWSHHENIYFIGYAFDEKGKLYQEAIDWDEDTLVKKIETISGAFAAILFQKDLVTVWCDNAASFPLFYKKEKDTLSISTQPQPNNDLKIIDSAAYKRIYCTEGHQTLLADWSSILAGHQLIANLRIHQIKIRRYFDHFVSTKVKNDAAFEKQFLQITQNWAHQIITYANGKQIWVPLSGGYDCRLLLSALIMAKAPNLHSYTYGRRDSPEIKMAFDVAQELDISWHFIPYHEQAFSRFFTDSWMTYAMKNHHYHTIPHEQDFFALSLLSENSLLEEGFIAITGHCGEIPAGSVLMSYPINVKDHIAENYNLTPQYYLEDRNIEPWDSFHQWLSENRLSKFITNSLRLFEYFGGKWMLPMWHRDFMQLFYSLEFSERWGQKAYIDLAFKHYFEPLNIDFRKSKSSIKSTSKTFKDSIKATIPKKLLHKIQFINSRNPDVDPCNLHVLYKMLYKYMKDNKIPLPEKDGDFNRLHAYYMLHLLEHQLQ